MGNLDEGVLIDGAARHERIETARLVLRRPTADDAEAMFTRYASNPEVTRFLGWPRHVSIEATRDFLAFSEREWERWPAGPYLLHAKDGGALLGSTGLGFGTDSLAMTGYVLARDAWGRGYATEALQAMVELAPTLGVRRLYAVCHTAHAASYRVLEKCQFIREGTLRSHSEFPNLAPGEPADVFLYASMF